MQTPSLHLLPKSTASILGTFFVYSGIPQMQGSSSWLWGFNALFLRLHGEISFSFLFSHSSWGSVLVLAPPVHVGHPQVSVPCPDKRGLKQQLIRALLLTQAREREGYGSHNWNAGWACSSKGQREVATAWGMPCVLPGKLSLDQGTLAVACCTGSWEGVGSDLHLHTGPLVTAVAAIAVCAHLWGPRWKPWLALVSGAHFGSALPSVGTWSRKPLSSCILKQWSLASPAGYDFFLDSLPACCGTLAPFRLCSHSQPQSSPRDLTSEAQASVPSPHPLWQVSRQAFQAGECWSAPILCAGISLFCPLHPCCCALLCGSKASPPPPPPPISTSEGAS